MTLPTGAPVARFRRDVEALVGPLGDRRLALAVSGGPDSMAMLALAAAAFPGQVAVATVDHRLRAASGDEAEMVAGWCARAAVPHATLGAETRRGAGDNLHDWARRERYRLLHRWAVATGRDLLATAHHADDQAETFLMRAARGSGVSGLAGIRARQRLGETMIELIRPLLRWRRHELRAIVDAAALPWIDDPSNADPRYDRTQFRALLAAAPQLDPAQLARAAAHFAEADQALRVMTAMLAEMRMVAPTGFDGADRQIWLDVSALPRELTRRLARDAIARVRAINGLTRPVFTDATNIEPLLDALEQGKAATQAGILVRPKSSVWRFTEAPPRRSHCQ